MESVNKTFELCKESIKLSPSSIFSNDDVIKLVEQVKQDVLNLIEEEKAAEANATKFTKDQIIEAAKDLLNEYSWDEFIECDPEINGSYGGSYTLEMNASFDEREFERSFLSELEDYFTPDNQ